jgi:membrane fusion protein (multidrug efflux system)
MIRMAMLSRFWMSWASALPTGSPLSQPSALPTPPLEELTPEPEPEPGRSRWWSLLFLAIGVLLGYLGYQQSQPETTRPAAVAAYRTSVVQRGPLRQTLRLGGTISARSYAAIVAPRLRGRDNSDLVLTKLAAAGSFVNKGDVVAEFDRGDQGERLFRFQAEVTEAEAGLDKRKAELAVALESARQQVRQARGTLEKARLDLRTAAVRSEIEASSLKLAVAEAEAQAKQLEEELALTEKSQQSELRNLQIEIERAKVQLQRIQINAEQMAIRTPISGTVVMMTSFRNGQVSQVALGDQVRPGTYFMQIVDPSTMILEATFNQADSQRLRVGQPAEVRLDAYPDRVWPARIVSLGATTAASGAGMRGPTAGTGSYVRNLPIAFSLEETDPIIIPDLSGSADVLLASEEDALIAPRAAIQRRDDETIVYVRQQGAAQPVVRPVELGFTTDTQVAVLSGLQEGEEVLLDAPRTTLAAARESESR